MTDYKVTVLTDKWDRFRMAHRTGGTIEIDGKVVEWYRGKFKSGMAEKPLYIDGKQAPAIEYEGQGELVNSEDELTRQAYAIVTALENRHHPEHCSCDACDNDAVHDYAIDADKATAYHEAGHALLARLLGMNIKEASIIATEDDEGHVDYEGDTSKATHVMALTVRGGGLGVSYGYYDGLEARFNKGEFTPDRERAAELDEACTCKPTLTERVLAHNAEAEELIKTHKQELHNLATVLARRGTLRGNEAIDAARNGETLEPRNVTEVKDLESWEWHLEKTGGQR